MSNEHNNGPAVPQGEPVAWKYELAVRIDAEGRGSGWCWHLTDYKPSVPDGMIRNLRPLTYADAAPAQERCSTCGYLTSEREHLGCLRRAVKDLDIATGGPYDAQEPVTLTPAEIDRAVLEATGFDGFGCQPMNTHDTRNIGLEVIAALRAKGGE